MPNSRSLGTLTAEDFRAFAGTSFLLTVGSGESGSAHAPGTIILDLELVEVNGSRAGAAPGISRAPFSLVFHGPLQPVVPQAIYRLEHAQLGELELFTVPVGPAPAVPGQAPAAMRYEVVFG